MHCIAHRGFAGTNPENTIPAFEDAAARADAVELDVRRCASGELVVHHDETVDRVTDASGPVSSFTADELAALSVEGTDAGVPTLAAVVDTLPAETTLHAELKETGLGDDLSALLADAPFDVVVSSFDADAVGEVRDLPTALTARRGRGLVERATDLGCTAVHPKARACTAAFVDRAHDADLRVNAWTITKPATTARLRDRGVDGVITDYPDCCPPGPS